MKYIALLLIILLNGCDFNKSAFTKTNKKSDCNKINLYIKNTFKEINGISIKNDDRNKINEIIKRKVRKDYITIDSNFARRFLCCSSNLCFGRLNIIDYVPFGYIQYNNFYILIYERYYKGFPILLNEIYAVTFDTSKCKVVDKIMIYRDNNVGIVNTGEISFKIVENYCDIEYKDEVSIEPEKSNSKNLKCYRITNERYKVDNNGKFILYERKKHISFYDRKKRLWFNK